jgi:hypothetical protein
LHAQQVIAAAKNMKLPRQGALIGLITALVESGLRNYANVNIPESMQIPHDAVGSDHYSVGIMQQQSGPFGTYWGTVMQCMDPMYAASRFFTELLQKVPNYMSIDPGTAAQIVQVSAVPDAYSKRVGDANALLTSIGYAMGGVLPRFAGGGIVNSATAGVFGERGSEAVVPLTALWSRLDSIAKNTEITAQGAVTRNITFTGDLTFPNIRSGEDAEVFIANLESLAGNR